MLNNFIAALFLCVSVVFADEHTHHYSFKEDVIFWVNTVGPYSNRQETYRYYRLPYCKGNEVIEHHHETLGEVLQGMELINAGVGAKFQQNLHNATLCTSSFSSQDIEAFQKAISQSYWYQMFVDDLPIWGFVGFIGEYEENEESSFLYTHRDFSIGYNGDQITEVNLTSSGPIKLEAGKDMQIRFSYSVSWIPSDVKFSFRFDKYLDQDFFEHKIHWFSIFNSFMMVIFLVGLVTIILLRTLRRDIANYDKQDHLADPDGDLGDEHGWKQVHGDVFRSPSSLLLLSSMIGTGYQLVCLSFLLLLYTILGDLYTERSTILTASIFIYAATSFVSGYTSGSYYSKYGGKSWIKCMLATIILWPGVASLATLSNDFVAIYYSSSRAIHIGTMISIAAIWVFLVIPLTMFGTIVGRNWSGQPNFPCRVNNIPRTIPEKRWYSEIFVIILLGGILPFGSIFIEMYFVFTSFWAYKIYYVYGFMLLVFLILLIVSSCVTIVGTYFLLNSEDYRWMWTSFLTSGSTSIYVFFYAIYYYFAKTKMFGFFQTFFYFSYTGVLCFGLFLMLGSVGFFSAEYFVRKIYSNVKID